MRRVMILLAILIATPVVMAQAKKAHQSPDSPPPGTVRYSKVPPDCLNGPNFSATLDGWTYNCRSHRKEDVLHYTGHYQKEIFEATRTRATQEAMGYIVAQTELTAVDVPAPPMEKRVRTAEVFEGERTTKAPQWKYKTNSGN